MLGMSTKQLALLHCLSRQDHVQGPTPGRTCPFLLPGFRLKLTQACSTSGPPCAQCSRAAHSCHQHLLGLRANRVSFGSQPMLALRDSPSQTNQCTRARMDGLFMLADVYPAGFSVLHARAPGRQPALPTLGALKQARRTQPSCPTGTHCGQLTPRSKLCLRCPSYTRYPQSCFCPAIGSWHIASEGASATRVCDWLRHVASEGASATRVWRTPPQH